MYKDPASLYFNVTERNDIIEIYNTHTHWTDNASNISMNTMPKSSTKKMEWMDRKSTLVIFMKLQPGRNGVPLNYVVRDNEAPITRPNANSLENYINRTLLTGIVVYSDASKVNSYIFQLIY